MTTFFPSLPFLKPAIKGKDLECARTDETHLSSQPRQTSVGQAGALAPSRGRKGTWSFFFLSLSIPVPCHEPPIAGSRREEGPGGCLTYPSRLLRQMMIASPFSVYGKGNKLSCLVVSYFLRCCR